MAAASAVARLARKQGNFALARRLLHDIVESADGRGGSVAAGYEAAKVLHAMGREIEAVVRLWRTAESLLDGSGAVDGHEGAGGSRVGDGGGAPTANSLVDARHYKTATESRLLLRLARWVHADPVRGRVRSALVDGEKVTTTSALWRRLEAHGGVRDDVPEFEMALSKACVQLAVDWSPTFAKGHLQHAMWCYREGRRVAALDSAGGERARVAAVVSGLPGKR